MGPVLLVKPYIGDFYSGYIGTSPAKIGTKTSKTCYIGTSMNCLIWTFE